MLFENPETVKKIISSKEIQVHIQLIYLYLKLYGETKNKNKNSINPSI